MPAERLQDYREKRDFDRTSEPAGERRRTSGRRRYVIQKHAARRLHFDFRLEHNGVLLSWAVPRGPSQDPSEKRLAVRTEDHPLEYGSFEGTIPKGEYGAGTVLLWDTGTWEPEGDLDEGLKKGKLSFTLDGTRLHGGWALVRLTNGKGKKQGKENWLLIKERDTEARPDSDPIVETEDTSITSGRDLTEIARSSKIWHSGRPADRGPAAKKAENAARDAKLPGFVEPALATLIDAPPNGDDWVHEIKFDGYRAIAAMAGGDVAIYTRSGQDWTKRFYPLVGPLSGLPCASALLDGEIAIADAEGHTIFPALQQALSEGGGGFGYYLFDLLEIDGRDLRKLPLHRRKQRLRKLLNDAPKDGPLFYSDHIEGNGSQAFSHACDLKLEGIISKRAGAPYRSGRGRDWLKSKCGMEQEFVIIGWRPSTKRGRPFSSLLVGVREEGELRYAGRVGTGLSDFALDDMAEKFRKLARKDAPAEGVPATIARNARFIEPKLVAEVAFRGWTGDGLVRQGAFKGLREDKRAQSIVRERPMAKAKAAKGPKSNDTDEIEGVRVTHPDRVLYPDQGITKRQLIEHYRRVAGRMLPHVAGRPLALVRCPRGSEKDCFFQKHASPGWPREFRKVRIREKSGADQYLYIEDTAGLVAAAQMSVLELHLWGSRVDDVEKPDRLVFDLDPDAAVGFDEVKKAARELRNRLKAVDLESFALVTGGKGIHVVVPLQRGHSWAEHRNFAEALARLMAEEEPDRFTAVMSKAKRKGKILIDYLRNQRGASAIAPYSTRARADGCFAVPVAWNALSRLENAHPFAIGDPLPRTDAWQDYFKLRQRLPEL